MPRPRPAAGSRAIAVMLFALSLSTIALEVVQVRILSYTINHAFVYLAVSLAMLGFGLSGTLLALAPALRCAPARHSVGACAALFALSAVAAHAFFARTSHLVLPQQGLTLFSPAAALLLVFALPYLFAGLGVGLALLAANGSSESTGSIGSAYFVNLLGSAAGCFAVYPFFGALGAAGVVVGVALLAAVTAALASAGRARAFAAVAALAVAACVPFASAVLPFQPDWNDQYHHARRAFEAASGAPVQPALEFSRWDPVGKIEIWRFPPPYQLFGGSAESRFFTQDAGAGSVLLGLPGHPDLAEVHSRGTLYGVATTLRPNADVLIIGVGGAPDVLAALHNGARSVEAAEINAATVAAVTGQYRDFLGLPAAAAAESDGPLRFVVADGRSWVRRFRDRYDVVQMTGADTYAASASGGSILAENYLYTVEAFGDYLRAIRPGGVVSITRFSWETVKVVTTMLAALRRVGVAQPERCIAILHQGPQASWGNVLAKREPFTADEVARLRALCAASTTLGPKCTIPVYEPIGFRMDTPMTVFYAPEADAGESGQALLDKERQSLADPAKDFAPPTDDTPFFFNYRRLRLPSLGEVMRPRPAAQYSFEVTDYLALAIQLAAVALLLILGPLAAVAARGQRLAAGVPVALYFGAIGTGFMLLEIALMQKCGLFLGHPNYAISTVLFALLAFSGLGSWVAGRWRAPAGAKVALAVLGIAAWVVAFTAFAGDLFAAWLHLPVGARITICAALLAPAGFLAGMPFPTGLGLVEARAPHLSGWAFGVNAFASVVASLAAIPTSMAIGFSHTLLLGAGAYVVALLALGLALALLRGSSAGTVMGRKA